MFLRGGALFQFEVLQADRGDRQHGRFRVGGQRFDSLFELQVGDRVDSAGARVLLRRHFDPTTPTLVPAIRTWLEACRPEASGSATLML